MGRLAGKVALITGAARGLGEADARTFAREGARVVLTDVDEEAGQAVAADIGGSAWFRHHDVRDEQQWIALMAEIKEREGRLDILVNNAGVVMPSTPETIEADALRFILDVSINGTIWGCKHAIPLMREGGSGSIINLSSITAVQGHARSAAYTAAKGAVDAYSRAVAVYCAQLGLPIRCNSLLPDRIDTPMVRGMAAAVQSFDPALADNAGSKPENVYGEVSDVANLALFLASDESKFINGQSFVIDNTASITKGAVPARIVG
ncbi:SDR family oxidoreductase [Sphingomonas jatrophae]|uniref:3(Or 17)beta-hydroxysteroid dehydrogenase n=1 Tax=Sphingomonas jatrophae TaxID=1166337 RepID=A0A1I6M4B5_9SPHN|nr:SDR family oxidoreductase [Sphingomonas jatrophae]SFS10555.1 3(or 17)beta-hydroxysteroid dehydrogenase [Sphingomonas jatrophae]